MRSALPYAWALVLVLPQAVVQAAEVREQDFTHTVYLQPYAKLRQRAEQGDAEAQYDLGYVYYKAGTDPAISGIIQSDRQAALWYRKAAQQGHIRAQYNMAVLHLHGRGVDRDPVEAYAWLLQAAAAGHEPSRSLLQELDTLLNEEQRAQAQQRARKSGLAAELP